MKKYFIVLLFSLIVLVTTPAYAKRIIQGKVIGPDRLPVAGYRVRALDSDGINKDDKMGEATTNSAGQYHFQYRKGTWDGPKVGTKWRPDIYIVVAKPKPGGGWQRVDQTGIKHNWKVKNDITQNFQIPNKGECPYPAKFKTTKIWRGCNCPSESHKRYLDLTKYVARCADGCSKKAKCDRKCNNVSQNMPRGSKWFGYDNDHGYCVKPSNIYAIHRQAYYKYFQNVSNGVVMEKLPLWAVNRYDKYFSNVFLAEIKIGESSKTPSDNTAITDCKKIYFPAAAMELERIRSENKPNYFLLLHEIAHADQCMKLNKGNFSTKRDKYADMWFSQLPNSVIGSIMTDGIPIDGAIHDNMPMELDADTKASQVIRATGDGSAPINNCPRGEFSTRKYRGCKCSNGKTKNYKGVFNEKAQCIGMKVIVPMRTP